MNLPIAEIVCLGNELLIGVTVNTNAAFIGEQLTRIGYEVRRITCIQDNLILGQEFFQELFSRKPDLIIVSGGLGPTYDDIQIEVLAKAMRVDLEINEIALEQIKAFYAKRGLGLTEERRKMAYFPKGVKILENFLGGAPSCQLEYNNMTIFCLPGVPTEMKDIFRRHLIPFLSKNNPERLFETKFQVLQSVESQLAPFINALKEEYANLYIKSHPAYKDKSGIIIHISGVGEESKEEIFRAENKLISLIKENLKSINIQKLED